MDAAQKAKLGQKWTCFSCGGKFYDLNRNPAICPRCEANQDEAPADPTPAKTRAKKATRKKKKTTKKKATKKKAPKAKAAEKRASRGTGEEDEVDVEPEVDIDELESSEDFATNDE